MTPFLQHVAEDIIGKYGTNLSQVTIVFPNKRAALFLNEHLARLAGGRPLWSPAYTTISELFRQSSTKMIADPVKLVCELHKAFTAQTGIDETLDHFYGWGQLLLSDFDDIDKQMADADKVFRNLADLKEMDDDSFLTPEQRDVLRRFFSNFTDSHDSELKQRFLRLWNRMGDIYHDFNRRLSEQGLTYEGAMYREVVDSIDYPLVLFVGFNVLLNVEHRLFTVLQRQGKARFYWDFDRYYTERHTQGAAGNEAGLFISQYLETFPNELDSSNAAIYDNFRSHKHITIASASTENIQARYIGEWLNGEGHIADGRSTAIVLCNEGLLPTVIHCLPEGVESVNITTGYPLAGSPVASLVAHLIALRRDGYDHQREHFRIRQVKTVLRHPYIMATTPQAATLLDWLTEQKHFFPTSAELSTDTLTALLFAKCPPRHNNAELLKWLCDIVQHIAQQQLSTVSYQLSTIRNESLFRTFTLLNRLQNLAASSDLTTDIVTIGRLIQQLIQQTTVPFHGEPAEGLQVMGLLETRNLDFKHLLILSAQEGNLPRNTSDTSFIPHNLRRAYGLTTQDHKTAIYSYYFSRILQRAEDITIVYNNSTADGKKGEMSRFVLQLMVESPHTISYRTLQGGQEYHPRQPKPVENHAQLPQVLSPTAINRYLRCPLQFHYRYVCQLMEPDDNDDDSIDNRIFGNIFHEAARIVYSRMTAANGKRIMPGDIDRLLKSKADIEMAVDAAIRQELFHIDEAEGRRRMPRLNGLQIINREVIIHYLRQLLAVDRHLAPFTILALEGDVDTTFITDGGRTVTVGGRIDRLDMITDKKGRDHIRVIDYKTGAHHLKPLAGVEAVFSQEGIKEHSDYYLQTMLYSCIVADNNPGTPVSPALLFIQHAGAEGYDPILMFGKNTINDIRQYQQEFLEELKSLIDRMFDPLTPLTPTSDIHRCGSCPYRQLCCQ